MSLELSNLKPIYDKITGNLNLIGKQGSSWKFIIRIKDENGQPIDLSDITEVRGQIRKTYSSPIVKTWNCQITNAQQGEITISLSDEDTSEIPCGESYMDPESQYVYDIEIEDSNGNVSRILQGKLFIDPEVTR